MHSGKKSCLALVPTSYIHTVFCHTSYGDPHYYRFFDACDEDFGDTMN